MDIKIKDKKFRFEDKLTFGDYIDQMMKQKPQEVEGMKLMMSIIASKSLDDFSIEKWKKMNMGDGINLLTQLTEKFGIEEQMSFLADK